MSKEISERIAEATPYQATTVALPRDYIALIVQLLGYLHQRTPTSSKHPQPRKPLLSFAMATTGIIKLEETCIMCPRRGLKRCQNCKDARYCSTGRSDGKHYRQPHTNQCADCQRVDWKLHKILCPTFDQEKPELTKHYAFHRRGLFFPGGDQKARFVWVEVWTEREGTWAVWDQFKRDGYFGREASAASYFSDPNPIQAREFMRADTDLDCISGARILTLANLLTSA